MATKPLQLDDEGNIMNDAETQKTQKAHANYEKEQADAQKKRESQDKEGPLQHWTRKLKRTFLGVDDSKTPVKKAKGGKVSSASRRADGCAVRGKTRA